MSGFGERLHAAVDARGSLCVGIDPHRHLLESWDLPDDASGARELGLRVVEAAAGRAAAVKPQIAFFERHGAAGFAALEEVLAAARASELLVVADVKRGDLGTSVDAYGEAWLTPGGPLEADAMTISAFQGVGSIAGPIERAVAADKGLFVLCATSNPEARAIQRARGDDGRTVARMIADEVAERADALAPDAAVRPLGLVIGATVDAADFGLELDVRTPALMPGFGAQGAQLADLERLAPWGGPVLASTSRQVLAAGAAGLVAAIETARVELPAGR